MASAKAPAIGIDLGTTYSCVGIFQCGRVEIIANDQGNRTTPSYVSFTDTERLVGDPAKSLAVLNPENTVFDVKRLIGRKYDDPLIQKDLEYWPFSVVNQDNKPKICVKLKNKNKIFWPEEISAMVLSKMKETAEMFLGKRVKDAVITVPAYFNDSQRQATKDIGRIADLNVLRIINEPTAAAIAYGLDKKSTLKINIIVFDLGGGTFDVSILEAERSKFEVKSTAGDTHLGGEDFDRRMIKHFVDEFKRKFNKDLSGNRRALQRLRTACERAKRTLSSTTMTSIEIDALFEGIDFYSKISRAKFEELNIDFFKSTLEIVQNALADAKIKKESIDEIVLVGGSTHIPKIRNMLKNFFNGKEPCMSINPDEAVAYGAAIQAAILSGDTSENIKDVMLIDVIPLSLGIETVGGVMTKLVERNTKIPWKTSQFFCTSEDYQTSVVFKIFEGERGLTEGNHLLGKITLNDIAPALREIAKFDVTFDIDANGILQVSAKDIGSGISKSITITNEKGRLTNVEIVRMLKEAKEYEREDQIERERIAARYTFESYIYSARHAAESSQTDKLSASDKENARNVCEECLSWLNKNMSADKNEIEVKMKEAEIQLSPLMNKFFQGASRMGSSRFTIEEVE